MIEYAALPRNQFVCLLLLVSVGEEVKEQLRGVIGELINGGLDCPVKCLLIPSGSTFVLLMAFQNRYFNITFEKCPLKINSLHCQQSIWPTTGTLGRQQTASSSRKEETYQLLK